MIAIHKSSGFAERWITYCEKNNIAYKLVNAYDSDIVSQVKYCDAFMWHFSHFNYKDMLIARQVLYSLQLNGLKVFPDFNTAWHFDDKVGQKYLLEAIGAPLVKSYVFYTLKEANKWISETSFPKVFKLRGGAGASNVKLLNSKREAKSIVKKAFGVGFKYYDPKVYLQDSFRKFREGKLGILDLLKSFIRLFRLPDFARMYSREKGYVYFQDFIADNNFDIRVVVVGDKAFALKRMTRKGDFRASGSGNIIYTKAEIDERCVKTAFEVNEKLKAQSIAYDFVFDKENNPLIVEISFGYSAPAYDRCEGYWTVDMQWHAGENFDFCGWMVENLIREI